MRARLMALAMAVVIVATSLAYADTLNSSGGSGINLQATPPTAAQTGGGWVTGIFAAGTLIAGFTTLPTALGRTHLVNDTGGSILGTLNIDTYSGGAVAPTNHGINVRAARGTLGTPTAIQANDPLTFLQAYGYQSGGAFSTTPKITLEMRAYGNWTSTAQGTYFTLRTTSPNTTARTLVDTVEIGTDLSANYTAAADGNAYPYLLVRNSTQNASNNFALLLGGNGTTVGGELWLQRSAATLTSRLMLASAGSPFLGIGSGSWSIGGRGDVDLTIYSEGTGSPGEQVRFFGGGATFGDYGGKWRRGLAIINATSANFASANHKGLDTWNLEVRKDASGAIGPRMLLYNASGGANAEVSIDAATYNFAANAPARIRFIDDGASGSTIKFDSKTDGSDANALTTRFQLDGATGDATVNIGNLFIKEGKKIDTVANGALDIGSTATTSITTLTLRTATPAAISTANGTGTAAGAVTATGGTGGAETSTSGTGTGGSGGGFTVSTGPGGAANGAGGTTHTGGKGGDVSIVAAAGGAAASGSTNNGGNGGDVTIDAGSGGSGSSATGTNGVINIGTANASTVTVGRSSATTNLQGSVQLGGAQLVIGFGAAENLGAATNGGVFTGAWRTSSVAPKFRALTCSWGIAGTGGTTGVTITIRNATDASDTCTCTLGACNTAANTPLNCDCNTNGAAAKSYTFKTGTTSDCATYPQNVICNAEMTTQ